MISVNLVLFKTYNYHRSFGLSTHLQCALSNCKRIPSSVWYYLVLWNYQITWDSCCLVPLKFHTKLLDIDIPVQSVE